MSVAGRPVPDPAGVLEAYALAHGRTVRGYDLAGAGDPDVLTRDEVRRTRLVSSRISDREVGWFVEQARDAPWVNVPATAGLEFCDPATVSGRERYAAAESLYRHFMIGRPRRVAVAKVSKVLHVKRPNLVPVLDAHLLSAYRESARRQGRLHPELVGTSSRLYWLAVREDLVDPGNEQALDRCRQRLASSGTEVVRLVAGLPSLRLMDILAWAGAA